MFEAFHIHGPPLNCIVLHDLVGPLAELDCTLVFNFEADGDYRLKIIVLHFTPNLPTTLSLNS
jgi:hypothetical protein